MIAVFEAPVGLTETVSRSIRLLGQIESVISPVRFGIYLSLYSLATQLSCSS